LKLADVYRAVEQHGALGNSRNPTGREKLLLLR
jgi:hypothetical protein